MRNILIIGKSVCYFTVLGSMILCGFSFPALAEERQYKVEAAFLYSFFNYITWPRYSTPQELQEPVICVNVDDPIIPYLDYIRAKVGGERTLTVRTIADEEIPKGCNIFFMRHRISSRILASLPSTTLMVLKPDDPLDQGGMIELSQDGERIAIKINQPQLEQNGFRISSRLLELAQVK